MFAGPRRCSHPKTASNCASERREIGLSRCTKNIWATYAHGPVLAMNPWFCDEILAEVYGVTLEPLTGVADLLYQERCRVLSA